MKWRGNAKEKDGEVAPAATTVALSLLMMIVAVVAIVAAVVLVTLQKEWQ